MKLINKPLLINVLLVLLAACSYGNDDSENLTEKVTTPAKGADVQKQSAPTEGADVQKQSAPTEGADVQKQSAPAEGADVQKQSAPTEGADVQHSESGHAVLSSTNTYQQQANAVKFMQTLAARDGYDENYLLSLLGEVQRDDSIIARMNRPAEKAKPWYEYEKIFDDQARLDNGIQFWRENAATLRRAEEIYGVDPYIIVAILGVETRYGKVTGKTPVLQALTTLCFDYPKREAFFCEQLDYYLRLSKRENRNPLLTTGSYAGAMGMAQFMPSSYYNDAIDFDGDGHVDLWNSPADAIGSIGNYLQKRGWKRGGDFVLKLPAPASVSGFGKTHKPTIDIENFLHDSALQNDRNVIKQIGLHSGQKVGSLSLETAVGQNQWWLTYNNFYVITRYNTSPLYAMAVINLAKRIEKNIIESK